VVPPAFGPERALVSALTGLPGLLRITSPQATDLAIGEAEPIPSARCLAPAGSSLGASGIAFFARVWEGLYRSEGARQAERQSPARSSSGAFTTPIRMGQQDLPFEGGYANHLLQTRCVALRPDHRHRQPVCRLRPRRRAQQHGPSLGVLAASAASVGTVAGMGEFVGDALRSVTGYLADRAKGFWAAGVIRSLPFRIPT
jgi:hypothetical protein